MSAPIERNMRVVQFEIFPDAELTVINGILTVVRSHELSAEEKRRIATYIYGKLMADADTSNPHEKSRP